MLKYETDIPVTDTGRLSNEVEHIWALFRLDAESAHVKGAIISATSPPSGGLVSHSKGFNFVYVKDSAGSWHRATGRVAPAAE